MKRTQWSTFGLGVGVLAAGAMTLAAVASVPSPALALPQEESAQEEARIDALRAEILARQKARLAELEEVQAHAIQERVARAESMAAALAQEIAEKSAQEHRVRMRAPLAMVRGFGFGGGSTADRVLAHAEELELTDAQQEAIRSAQKQHRRDAIEREAATDLARLDLDELMDADDDALDLAAVEAKLLEISRLEVQDQIAGLRLRQRVRETLTPEQREELEEMGGVFVLGNGAFGWRDGGLMFDAPARELLFELRDRMPRWEHRFLRELPEGRWFFRHQEDDDEEEGDEEGEVGEIVGTGRAAGSKGAVAAL